MPVHIMGAYVQDDWTLGANFTLNLGLRYDLQLGSYGENLDDNFARIADVLGPGAARYPIPVPFIDTSVRGDKNNFGPRVGFAWDPRGTGSTSVHAGYGMFYENMRTLGLEGELTWPQAQQIVISRPSYPDPLQGQSRDQFISTAPPNITVMDNRLVSPYAHHYTAGFTQRLAAGMGLSVDAVFVKRYSDPTTVDINLPDQVTRVKPYPQFARVSVSQSAADNDYKALLVKLDKRMSNNTQFLVSYTLAKADDILLTNRLADRYGYFDVDSPAAADRRNRLVASGIFGLPWQMQLSAIFDYRSALPFNPTTNLDLNNDGYTGDLPAGVLPGTGCRSLNLDAANAFRASRGLAPVAESSIACPDWVNVDVRFTKAFNLPGQQRIELLAQVLNVFNRSQLDIAQSNLQSAAFGASPGLVPFIINAPSRQLEFALRYQF
jgi:hypothetical protein